MNEIDGSTEQVTVAFPSDCELRSVVERFYEIIRTDPLLGPVFTERVDHWPTHLDRIHAFWSSVMLGTGRYKGNPFAAHQPLRDRVGPEHFERWLSLWSRAARQVVGPSVAATLEARAGRIADSLMAGILLKVGGIETKPETAAKRPIQIPSNHPEGDLR